MPKGLGSRAAALKAVSAVDWNKVKKELAAGALAKDLAKKYGVSHSSIRKYGKGRSDRMPLRSKSDLQDLCGIRGALQKLPAKVSALSSNGLLSELRAERDQLNAVIEFLEKRESR